ncbi:DMT family transporter [Candidatus Leptofilum sp.]|uniref:DMT family transporter n=1 Tax=Candidatus Leptofilum sp. TaxID=3241576 RepID=UPI003B5B18A3
MVQQNSPPGAFPLLNNVPLVLTILLLLDSLHFVFARLLRIYLPPVQAALFVLGFATLETAVFLTWKRQIQLKVLRHNIWFFAAVGLLVAGATSLSFASVRYVDAGTASMLAQTTTLFALGFGLFWLREKLQRLELLGAGIALLGIFVVSFQPGDVLRLGSLIVLASSFLYALHAAVVKRYGQELDFANFFLFRVGGTTFFLLIFVLLQGEESWQTPSNTAWLVLLLVATVDVVCSRVLYYLALRRLQMSHHAILLTLSPVIAILWSLLLFGEGPTWQGFIGGTAVLAGVIIVTWQQRRPKLS